MLVLEGRYKTAIASSPRRERVLRALAKVEKNGECWTTDAYPIASSEGVENPSQYVGHLVTQEYGKGLVKVRERFYRFRDSLFRAYVCARPPQYDSVEEHTSGGPQGELTPAPVNGVGEWAMRWRRQGSKAARTTTNRPPLNQCRCTAIRVPSGCMFGFLVAP